MTGDFRIGVDLGGTKIEIVALDIAGIELVRRRFPTPAGDYASTVGAIAELVRGVEKELGAALSIGIGTPGAASPGSGSIKNANSTVLIGKPLQADIEHALRRPVRLANDADCFALSEAIDGAARGDAIVFGVILGTGVGGGLVVDGRLVRGPNAITGEWGHNPLPWPREDERPGPACYCGKDGCLETWLSGPAFTREASRGRNAAFTDARMAVRAAADGDAGAGHALVEYVDRLARGLATIVNVVDPTTIVLGGGMSNVRALAQSTREVLRSYAFTDDLRTKLTVATHGDSSGVRGAARLWPPSTAGDQDRLRRPSG